MQDQLTKYKEIRFKLPNGGFASISKRDNDRFLLKCYTTDQRFIAQYSAYSITEAVQLVQYLKGSLGKRVLQRVS